VITNPTIDEVGYKKHLELLEFLETNSKKPIVLDSKAILINPERTLHTLCSAIGIPFEENMLKWPSKPRKEDGVWAKYWYKSVHQSTHFMNNQTNTNSFPKQLNELLEECMPYYNRLLEYSIG
jgi:hypothetical protein